MRNGKLISAATGVGAWLIALALGILDVPDWVAWLMFAVGFGFVITAALWWVQSRFGQSEDERAKREAVDKILSEIIWKAPGVADRNSAAALQAWKSAAHGVIDLAFGPLETAKFEQVAMDQVFRDEPMDPPKIIVERYADKLNDLVARIHSVPLRRDFASASLKPFHEQVAKL